MIKHDKYHPLRQHSVEAITRARKLLDCETQAQFAAAIGVTPYLVALWHATPTSKRYYPLSLDLALAIHEATQGRVTVGDLLPNLAPLFALSTPSQD